METDDVQYDAYGGGFWGFFGSLGSSQVSSLPPWSGLHPTLPLLLTFPLPTLLLAKDPGSYFCKPRVAAVHFWPVSLWSKIGLYSRFCVESSPVAFPVVVVVLLSSFSLRPLSPLVLLFFCFFLLLLFF